MNITPEKLQAFISKNDNNFSLGDVDEQEKKALLKFCTESLELQREESVVDYLRCLRILTRDDACLDLLTAEACLSRFTSEAFPVPPTAHNPSSTEALKCLINLILKRRSIVSFLISQNIVNRLLDRMKLTIGLDKHDDNLLMDLKMLFLLSALDPSVRQQISQDNETFLLMRNLISSLKIASLSASDCQLICEALKIAYNIGYAFQHDSVHSKNRISDFTAYCLLLRDYLVQLKLSDQEQHKVFQQIVNFFNVVPKRCFVHLLFSPVEQSDASEAVEMSAIQALLEFLDHHLPQLPADVVESMTLAREIHLSDSLCPILNTLVRACQGNRSIRKYCRAKVLPYLGAEVKRLPEQGSTLRNRLCKLLTNPSPGISELVAFFLFVLCKEDIGRAVKYTGFGNFAGFLARHALLGSASKKSSRRKSSSTEMTDPSTSTDVDSAEEYSDRSSESDTEEYERLKESVNPVTGRWESAKPNPLEGMSEEQKEHMVMELVRDIDRLQRGGIIQPGKFGDDGTVKPAGHVLELLEGTRTPPKQDSDSD